MPIKEENSKKTIYQIQYQKRDPSAERNKTCKDSKRKKDYARVSLCLPLNNSNFDEETNQ